MNRFIITIILFTLFLPTVISQGLNDAIQTFANDASLKYGTSSVSIIDVESGKLLAGHNSKMGLTPASSMKVITTASALHFLGRDFKFKTELQYDGSIDADGTLNGNLYIKGSGDPTLGSHQFKSAETLDVVIGKFVKAIQAAGIKKINGIIVGDASYFGTLVDGRKWLWEDIGNYYGAGAFGLCIQENMYFIDFQQVNSLGATPPIEKIRPYIPNLMMMNEVKSDKKGTGDQAYIFGTPYSYTRFVRGTIPVGNKIFTVKGAIPDPPFFAAQYLMKFLEKENIQTNKMATSFFEMQRTGVANDATRNTIYTYESPTLDKIVKFTNEKSNNLYCEAMLRMIGKKEKGEGSAEAGLKAIYEFLENGGMNTDGFFMLDGSGLSPVNSVSSYNLAKAMQIFLTNKKIAGDLKSSIRVSSRIGNGQLRAKSGSMERVRSYTGFATTKSGRLVSFSIIANNFMGKSSEIRRKMEKLMLAIYSN